MTADSRTTFDSPLEWHDAGTAALSDTSALQHLISAWVSNVNSMADRAEERGWELCGPEVEPGLGDAAQAQLAATLGLEALPGQLAWAFAQTAEWRFGWRALREDEPRGELSSCYGGGIRDTLWSADTVAQSAGSLMSWAEGHAAQMADEGEEDAAAAASALLAFWRQHVAFHHLPNGDFLALDLRHPDPQRQPVRYFSHEQDGLHGRTLAPDFFSFVSRWTALGCVGSEWWSWEPFTVHGEPDSSDLAPSAPFAQRWVAWLDEVPPHLGGAVPAGRRPPSLIVATTEAELALLAAARANDLPGVKRALDAGARPDVSDESDWQTSKTTAVMLAARHGNLDMLELLLHRGASLATHALPLATVFLEAPVPALKWLIENGARIDPWSDDRFCALHRLYDRSDLEEDDYLALLDAMLATGCDPDVFHDTQSVASATTLLMRSGPLTAHRLLAAGANPLRRDAQGRTAMHCARDTEHVALLAGRGLSVNDLSTPDNPTEADRPLHFNLSAWSPEPPVDIVAALLDAGADPALTDGRGHNAWWHCRHLECALLLAAKLPFDATWRDETGSSPLHHMVRECSRLYDHVAGLLRYWCQNGLDVNAQDSQGNTALHLMARCCESAYDRPSVALLLELGADTNLLNLKGQRPAALIPKKHRSEFADLLP